MAKKPSRIVIKSEFAEGLYKIEKNDYLIISYFFHKAGKTKLKGVRRKGKVKGVFASRSANRPNPIAISTVKLLERINNELKVLGLDAIDETPVLDIKPYSEKMDSPKKFQEK